MHENFFRQDVNPIDQATFIVKFMNDSKNTLADVAKITGYSEQWVQLRIDILSYPEYLIVYIYEGKISLGAAQYLAQIEPEPLRVDYCRIASIRGINIATAKNWLTQAQFSKLTPSPSDDVDIENVTTYKPNIDELDCMFCHKKDNVVHLYNGWFHEACRKSFDDVSIEPVVDYDNNNIINENEIKQENV